MRSTAMPFSLEYLDDASISLINFINMPINLKQSIAEIIAITIAIEFSLIYIPIVSNKIGIDGITNAMPVNAITLLNSLPDRFSMTALVVLSHLDAIRYFRDFIILSYCFVVCPTAY